MENETAYFWLILTAVFVLSTVGSLVVRRRRRVFPLRRIRGYQAIPLMIDQSIESNQRVHISLGSAAVGQPTTLVALAALTLIYELAKRQAFTESLPIVTVSDPITLASAQDALRRAYLDRNNVGTYQAYAVHWFPQGDRSIAFGAAMSTLPNSYHIAGDVLVGEFGAELAFVGETKTRRNSFMIGHSTRLVGQAIAYAQADVHLIGEEIFVGDAYLDRDNPQAIGRVIALDVLRWIIIAVIIAVALVD